MTETVERSFLLNGNRFVVEALGAGLYIVATPIGNRRDITIRALEVLAGAALIACEDTRHSAGLLRHYGIDRPLIAYHDHSGPKQRERILGVLSEGGAVALISDAGTPLLSDPGYRLVAAVIEAGHAVVPVPGASSLLAALVGAGQPTDQFRFVGFLPAKRKARQDALAALKDSPATLVIMEGPHRLADALADMADALGPDRGAAICRELTKIHETFDRDTLGSLAARYAAEPTRGEIVIVVAPAPDDAAEIADDDLDHAIAEALATQSVRDTVLSVSAATGVARGRVYQRALTLKKAARDGDA